MKAIIKRNLKNYLKNPIFWIGLIVVLISMYQTLAPYLSIHYVRTVGERDCKDTSGHREWVWHVGSRGGGSDI